MLRRIQLALVLLVAAPLLVLADGIPAKALADVKASTVFIKVEMLRGGASGSGFILSSDGETAYIVTNDHVVTPPEKYGPARSITVVFNSGKAKDEKSHSGTVLAVDADLDLAVLKVTAKGLPKAISRFPADEKPKLSETATVYTLGFPLGSDLSTTDGNPAVTVTKSSITSLREDDFSELMQIQIEGGSNPGNSGGPLVDEHGRLIGIVNAKVRNTNIGFAIPTNHLDRVLLGRLLASSFYMAKLDNGKATVDVEVLLADPLNKIRSVQVRYYKGDKLPPEPGKNKPYPLLAEAKFADLKRDGATAKATLVLDVSKDMNYVFQFAYSNGTKTAITTQPVVKTLNEINIGSPSLPSRPTLPGPPAMPQGLMTFSIDPKAPKPEEAIFADKARTPGEVVTEVLVQTDRGFGAKPVSPCLCWNPTWKSFYAIDHGAKQVRRLSFPDMKEEALLDCDQNISWVALSDEGLIVTIPEAQEAWICHQGTLKKKESFPIGKATRVLASPNSKWAYAVEADDHGLLPTGGIQVVDLSTRKATKTYTANDLGKVVLKNAVLSPDGKSIFTAGMRGLFRLAVTDAEVSLADARAGLVRGTCFGPCSSLDGTLCAAPSGAGNSGSERDLGSGSSTYIFEARDLKKPLAKLDNGSDPKAVGFDQHNGLIYTQSRDYQLMVFDKKGTKLKALNLVDKSVQTINHSGPIQFLVHPDGGKLAILLENGALLTVDLKLK
jgi:S1-C subfamily serine protease